MCLIAFALGAHPRYPFIALGNRDEYHARPTARAAWWSDAPSLFAGRDLQSSGTWMGVTREGRFAALTNHRGSAKVAQPVSRGLLVADYLRDDGPAGAYLYTIAARSADYDGFNLICGELGTQLRGDPRAQLGGQRRGQLSSQLSSQLSGDVRENRAPPNAASNQAPQLHYLNNQGGSPQRIAPGMHGLSNAHLNTPWPKTTALTARMADALKHPWNGDLHDAAFEDSLFMALLALLADAEQAPDATLPRTGVPHEMEKRLSAIKIISPAYGTRTSTLIVCDALGQVTVIEQTWDSAGEALGTQRERFALSKR
jgi:uncharacterized protein with NRDE domain